MARRRSDEFCTFDETLKKLGIDESKLKRLVSEGEVRAFREGDQMMFRRADIDNLVLNPVAETEGDVIDLSRLAEESETLTDDLIFDEGDDFDFTSAEQIRAAAEEDVREQAEQAESAGPSPAPTLEDAHRDIAALKQANLDLLDRVRALEDWRGNIKNVS